MDAIERETASICLLELPKLPPGVPEPLNSPSRDARAILKQSRSSNASTEDKDNTQGSKYSSSPSCRRVILADYEKEATFHPKLNSHSLKIAAKSSSRSSASISNRIFEVNKGHLQGHPEDNTSSAAKPNLLGLRSTQDRMSRLTENQSKSLFGDPKASTQQCTNYTFRPQVSERSMRIAEGLGTSFLDRQLMHMERKQRLMDEVHRVSLTRPKRLLTLRSPLPVPEGSGEDTSLTSSRQLTANLPEIVHSKSSPSHPTADPRAPGHSEGSGNMSLLCSPKPCPERPSSVPVAPPRAHQTNWPGDQEMGMRGGTECGTPPKSKAHKMEGGGGGLHSSSRLMGPVSEDGDVKRRARVRAEKAVKNKKVFLVKSGYRALRRTLRERGWVEQNYKVVEEKPAATPPKKLPQGGARKAAADNSDDDDGDGDEDDVEQPLDESSEEEWSDEEEYCLSSQHLHAAYPHFIWTLKREPSIYNHLRKDQIVNHFARAYSITTKVGLTTNLQNVRWFGDVDPDSFYPRCYVLGGEEDKEAFVDDYRFTAAMSLLKLLVTRGVCPSLHATPPEEDAGLTPLSPPQLPPSHEPEKSPRLPPKTPASRGQQHGGRSPGKSPSKSNAAEGTADGSVGETPLQLAMKACQAYLDSHEHKDIEGNHHHSLTNEEWNMIIKYFYTASLYNGQFSCASQTVQQAKAILDQLEVTFTQFRIDGCHNMWIMKPGAMSRGRGISCKVRLEDVLEVLAGSRVHKDGKWVIQKYIERPMLIYGTKFDIRQWFLVTDWNPLTMWMYKECYLRFSGQPYSLDDLDLSIHLCNNSIQKYYENSPTRAKELPKENMWDSTTFQNYLNDRGEGDMWMSMVYPGMKQAIIHSLLVVQDEVEHRKNTFELFGADFMITEDFRPWLIEINCSPTMESSTMVTARMCREVLEDTVKVVIDRKDDKQCSTGNFELAYKQPKLEPPNCISLQLYVQGTSIRA